MPVSAASATPGGKCSYSRCQVTVETAAINTIAPSANPQIRVSGRTICLCRLKHHSRSGCLNVIFPLQSPPKKTGQSPWGNPELYSGKIKICDTLRAVTPFGGLSVLIEFFGRIGLVEQLQSQEFYRPKSPNHYQSGQILVGFMLRSLPVRSDLLIATSCGPTVLYRPCLA
jgi:hypothetical protein